MRIDILGNWRRDGRLIGLANHCALHRLNTWTEDLMKPCNAGLLEQGVSLTKFCKCQYYFPDLSAAIEHLFCPEKELIDNDLDFVVQVRKVLELAKIDLTALQQRCNYDVKKGLRAPVSAAPTRWGTSLGAQTYGFESHPLFSICYDQILVARPGSCQGKGSRFGPFLPRFQLGRFWSAYAGGLRKEAFRLPYHCV